ncbi:MAG TPA: tRNA (N6-isopentenyl adenosine(37)-C2)-methylthiotransferase MiaB [Pyrinomonadaceae bacterium]|jgi:tRNA-2-methylthio-N6-dimethylallyladenosine synthase|nr:tRNA (N6-isopentenyl adenosine(37)-C2)-methylthiotransferase MiaB [Pyrinomonadaceae bacterium]
MKGSVYIETFGCQMNVSDSERAAAGIRSAGFSLTASMEEADVVIFNTCSIRAKAEQKVFNRIGEVRSRRGSHQPIIGLMGCVAQLEGEEIFKQAPSVRFVAGTGAVERLPALIGRAQDGQKRLLDICGREPDAETVFPLGERHSEYVAFVPIIEGCNKFCTYCIVPYSRGRERSRPASEILEEVRRLASEGYSEIHLIGQNVNSYRPKVEDGLEGFEGGTPFSRLLRAVASTGFPRVKFTTSFPRDFHKDIVAAIEEHENLCNWVHLPVQSGNDRVLRAMRRGYKAADYLEKVEAVKGAKRNISLTSDIIVGFPGETEREFEDTLTLVEKCQFEGLYIFKYSERPGTPASKLPDDVSEEEKTRRFIALERLQMSTQRRLYGAFVGSEVKVLVEGASAKSSEDLTGHTTCHKVVNFRGPGELQGKIVSVKITHAKEHSLYGELAA